MLGIVLTAPVAAEVEAAAREHGFLVNAVAPDVVRLVPPLVLTDTQADSFLALSRRSSTPLRVARGPHRRDGEDAP